MGGLRRRTGGLKMDGWLEEGLVAKEEGLLAKSKGRLLVTVSFLDSNSNCSPQKNHKWLT
jgi:hypothetical protein